MTSLVGILSLLSALTATSSALSCTMCMSDRTSSCSGFSMTCPSDHRCGTEYTETVSDTAVMTDYVRYCTPSSQCDFKGSIGIKGGHIKKVIACCSTDNCTPTLPAAPTTNSNPNGLVCRSCIAMDATSCYTSDTLQCTGDENRCLLYTTKVTGPVSTSTAIRGCATKSVCEYDSMSQTIGQSSTEVKFICTNDGITVHKIVLTPAIACLLLLKFF